MSTAASGVSGRQLRYVNDDEPGISRRPCDTGFAYTRPSGRAVKRAGDIRRIEALAIPPAWEDVWICGDAMGHIQATGRDLKGRKQYRYHELWQAQRDMEKYSLLADFARSLPALRKTVDADLRRHGLPREKVLASVIWLLDNTMIRVGNDSYARDNQSFGLTTLKADHLDLSGGTIRFRFKGKSGRSWDVGISDRRMARIIRAIEELPGQRLFRYRDANGELHDIGSHDVNAYIREAIGERFSSKDFRTWGGTLRALIILAGTEVPETQTAQARVLNGAIDMVAKRLGNTRAVCRACYIHPTVPARWTAGKLGEDLVAIRAKRPRKVGLDAEECVAALWLEKYGRSVVN